MVNQVGRPAIFDGKRFLPLMGTPIAKMLFSRTLFADWAPEPLTVATWMLKSLTTSPDRPATARGCSVFRVTSLIAIGEFLPQTPDSCWPEARFTRQPRHLFSIGQCCPTCLCSRC